MLVVTHLQDAIGDDDAVCGAKAGLHPAGEVNTLLNEDHRVGAGLPGCFHEFQHIRGVSSSAFVHFLVEPGQVLSWILSYQAKGLAESELAQCVRVGTFSGVIAAFVLVVLAQTRARRAIEPSVGRGCREEGVCFRWHPSGPPHQRAVPCN
ncbi:MAG: hypothetical protein BWY63_03145 [Chloroflexi bacterium ADurb.Bin360]|nr:MAG: hypothetical protein BWY63_03145 [Chloroflexi bacterium ADurb.Bin360]